MHQHITLRRGTNLDSAGGARHGRLRRLLVTAAVLIGGLWVAAPAAHASVRYYSTASSLAVRTGPGTTWSAAQYLGYGTALDIDCQVQGGTSVGGNGTWDHLTSGRWVSDYWTTSPSYNSYIPGVPQCSREWRALAWASARVGSTGWDGWCELFVENSYGTSAQYGSALADFNAQTAAGRIHYDTNPPAGALVFYRNAYDGGYGHVELSRGDGSFITTGSTVQIVGFSWGGRFLGWSYAPPTWAGRW